MYQRFTKMPPTETSIGKLDLSVCFFMHSEDKAIGSLNLDLY